MRPLSGPTGGICARSLCRTLGPRLWDKGALNRITTAQTFKASIHVRIQNVPDRCSGRTRTARDAVCTDELAGHGHPTTRGLAGSKPLCRQRISLVRPMRRLLAVALGALGEWRRT